MEINYIRQHYRKCYQIKNFCLVTLDLSHTSTFVVYFVLQLKIEVEKTQQAPRTTLNMSFYVSRDTCRLPSDENGHNEKVCILRPR